MEEVLVLFNNLNTPKKLNEIADVVVFDCELGIAFIKTELEKDFISGILGVTKVIKKSEL